jgi:hypothetical protein
MLNFYDWRQAKTVITYRCCLRLFYLFFAEELGGLTDL